MSAQGGAASATADRTPELLPHEWSPEIRPALRAYQEGDFATATRLARELRARREAVTQGERGPTAGGEWKYDALAIEALCLLRADARADRLSGRTLLGEAVERDPTLRHDPECELAYGIAQTALGETSTALDALERAFRTFRGAGLDQRAAEALVALAEAWAIHAEWSGTPPADASAATAVRLEKLKELRGRSAQSAALAPAGPRIDLIMGRVMLNEPALRPHAVELLQGLSERGVDGSGGFVDATGARAAMLLGEHLEKQGEWEAALALYERVRGAGKPGDGAAAPRPASAVSRSLSEEASARISEIRRPRVEVELPSSIAPDVAMPVPLRTRGLDHVRLEIRRVDLDAWLSSPRSRGRDAALTESGSLQHVSEFSPRAPRPYDWWSSEDSGPSATVTLRPGAYVVLVEGAGPQPARLREKRLLLVSDLAASVFVDTAGVLVWAENLAADPPAAPMAARFWMQGSFQPTELRLADHLARCALPAEARVMREREWICLVQQGEHLALCRGQVPQESGVASAPAVALAIGPAEVEAGDVIRVAGLLLPTFSSLEAATTARSVELQWLDAVGRLVHTSEVDLVGNSFATDVAVHPAWAEKHLHVVVRLGRRVLASVTRPAVVRVRASDRLLFDVRTQTPAKLPDATGLLSTRISAQYPSGATTRAAYALFRVDGRVLPAPELPSGLPRHALHALVQEEGDFEVPGARFFDVNLSTLQLPQAPLALRANTMVEGWEGRRGEGESWTLIGPSLPHTWVSLPPSPAVGQPVVFGVGWFDPASRTALASAAIEVHGSGKLIGRLPLRPVQGAYRSAPWRPEHPGEYTVRALLVRDGTSIPLTRTFRVDDSRSGQTGRPPYTAAFAVAGNGPAAVVVHSELDAQTPELIALHADRWLAAVRRRAGAGPGDTLLPLDGAPVSGLEVVVLTPARAGSAVAYRTPVMPGDPGTRFGAATAGERLAIALGELPEEIWPGQRLEIAVAVSATAEQQDGARARSAEPGGECGHLARQSTDVLARVVPLGVGAGPELLPADPPTAASDERDSPPDSGNRLETVDAPAWGAHLTEGKTLWATSTSLRGGAPGKAVLDVQAPTKPGLYRLQVLARTLDGAMAGREQVLDVRRGIELGIDVPESMIVGDIGRVAVRLENGGTDVAEVRVHGAVADILRIDAVPDALSELTNNNGEFATVVRLPAGGVRWVYAPVTALEAGRAGVEVRAELNGHRWWREAICQVVQPANQPVAAEGRPLVALKRTLLLRVPDDDPRRQRRFEEPSHLHRRWTWTPLRADQQIAPGDIVRVREELEVPQAHAEVLWTQRLPANCVHPVSRQSQLMQIGTLQESAGGTLEYRVAQLAPGSYVHEFVLAAARTGNALLPEPRVRDNQGEIAVQVRTPEIRLRVSE